MKASLVVGVVLIVAGVLALLYDDFTYARESKDANIGLIQISIQDREIESVPTWLGVVSIVVGGGMLLVPFTGQTGRAPSISR